MKGFCSTLILILVFTNSLSLYGQGFSFSTYYSPLEYGQQGDIGHPQNWAFHLDKNQYMHVGNGDGFLTFDGVSWNSIHIGEAGRGISFLLSSSDQMYVNGSKDFGRVVPDSLNRIAYRSISQHFYGPNDEMPIIWEVYEIGDNIYYRHNTGIAVYHPEENKLNDFSTSDERLYSSFEVDQTIFVDGESGLWAFKDTVFTKVRGSEVFEKERLFFALRLPDGNHLLGSTLEDDVRTGRLRLFDGTNLLSFDTEAEGYLKENFMYDAVLIDDQRIAIATIYGGVVFISTDGKLLKIFNERTGLHTNSIYDLYLDHEENLWMGLAEGIQKLNLNEEIESYHEIHGIENTIDEVAEIEGDIFLFAYPNISTNRTLVPENIEVFEPISTVQGLNGFFSLNSKGYFYNESNGLFRLDKSGDHVQVYGKPVIRLVKSADRSSIVTLIGKDELIEFDGKRIKTTPVGFKEEIGFAAELMGEIFVVLGQPTGGRQIRKLKDGVPSPVPIKYDTTQMFRIIEFGVIDGRLFAGVEGAGQNSGLYEYYPEENQFRKSEFLSDHPDFQNKQVFRFQQCSNGDIWFSANKKVLKVSDENGGWKSQESPYQNISKRTVYAIECTQKGVWLGGTSVLNFVKHGDHEYEQEFLTNITGIYISGDSLIYGGYGEPSETFVLPYANNELRFTYAAASYISPEDNTYQVKLEGFDDDWSNWTSETQKDYTNIPEGEYTFMVRSRNVYDVAGIMDAIDFEILPPWYRTWWAYLLYTLSIGGMLYLAYRIRINQILRVQRIRNSIASDLHDEVSATLSSISYFAQAIESDKVTGDKNRFVKLIANSAGDAKEKITDIVWAINPEHDDWRGFLSKCRRYASDLLESKDMNYSLKIDEFIPGKLDMQLRQHLWLIFKEMVTNAARHSEAENLDVIMKYEDGKLKLVIQDDGKGMDVDGVKKGNGLVNIHKRADLINADISLKTSEGFGTRWMLHIPI